MANKNNYRSGFFIRTSKTHYGCSILLSVIISTILSYILYTKYKSLTSFLFILLLFFILIFRSIEFLTTKKSIDIRWTIYGPFTSGREAMIDFGCYIGVLVTIFLYFI